MKRGARGGKYIIVAAVLTALFIGYKFFRHDFLHHQLQKIVEQKTKQLYTIAYDSISVDEVNGNVYIRNLKVTGDTLQQLAMIKSGDTNAVKLLYTIFIPLLKVEGFRTAKALLSKELECSRIVLLNPQVKVYVFPGVKETDVRKQQQVLYKQLLGNFRLIHADSVAVVNAGVAVENYYTKELKLQTYQTTVGLHDVAIDSLSNFDTTRTLFCREIKVSTKKISFGGKEKMAQITNVSFDTRSTLLAVGSFSYDTHTSHGDVTIEFSGIVFKGAEWTGPVENSALAIADAEVEKVRIETASSSANKKSKAQQQPILSGWLRQLWIGKLHLKSATFISKPAEPAKKPLQIANNDFLIKSLHLDSTAMLNGNLFNRAKAMSFSNEEISIRSSNGLYIFRFRGVKLSSLKKMLFVKSVKIIPLYSEAEFMQKSVYQTDRFDVSFANVALENLDVEQLLNGKLFAKKGSAGTATVKVFRDLNYKIDSASRIGAKNTYPHQLLHTLNMPVDIAQFSLASALIEYKEREIKSKESGRVRFVHTNLTLTNVSNQPAKAGEKMIARFTTLFLGKVHMQGSFTFFADKWSSGKFAAEATTSDTVDATLLNQLTIPMTMARVEKGKIFPVHFFMSADTATAHGTLKFPYEDLKLSLLKKKGDEYKKKDVMSILGNLLVKNSNRQGEKMRIAEVEEQRDIYRSFFHFIWMTVFKGLKEVMLRKI